MKDVMFKEIANANPRLANGKIHQSDRNNLRLEAVNDLLKLLNSCDGFEAGLVSEGIAINVQNEELGNINFVIDVKMKNLDYDFDFEVDDYAKVLALKEEKAKEKLALKNEKIKNDKIRREKIAEQKAKEQEADSLER